ncbi:hypothetical protein Kisp01_71650 [Kineosporia sp. NBRC 101677]|uniref:hypothetical protein n=1 Tax=Kineosporia sp. NBRC 101677 TaxID=3032197 RepID=UPI0024A17242|nr:hypothetical protein [Kineosporia sp. NBRC 101677]GLY20151.1 hypothetical protein Kisp01_71650 [Kineosporia sp. NBRC 101677]
MSEAARAGHEADPTPESLAGSAYIALATTKPGLKVSAVRQVLLRRLVEVTCAENASLWRVTPGSCDMLRSVLSWPPESGPTGEVRASMLSRHPQVQASVVLTDPNVSHTALTLATRRRVTRRVQRELADTVNCLMVLHRREQLRDELHDQTVYTSQLAGEVLDFSRRLAGVRDLERRRVASEVAAFSHGRLNALQQGVDDLSLNSDVTSQVRELRTHLDRLTADFRALARGIRPQVLYRHGVRAALLEMAAVYPGRIRITGSLPSRVDHEVSASLYYLAVGCLHALAASGADLEVFLGHSIEEDRASGLRVIILAWTQQSEAEVRAALAGDTDRLCHLGGRVLVSAGPRRIRVEAWVPDRLEPVSRVALVPTASFHTRVRAQALSLVALYAQGPGSASSRRVLNWLDDPVHVVLTDLPSAGRRAQRLAEIVARRPDLVSMPDTSDVSDVIIRPWICSPERHFEVQLPGAGLLRASCEWNKFDEVLTTEVVARTSVLRARTALAGMFRLVQIEPPPAVPAEYLLRDLRELRESAAELDELEQQAAQCEANQNGAVLTTG